MKNTNIFSKDIEMSSNRTFGLVMSCFFFLIGFYPMLVHHPVRFWALLVSGCFLVLALLIPKSLFLLNQIWMRFGLLLSMIVSPLAMGVVFYVVLTPCGLLMRLFGRHSITQKIDVKVDSYWIERKPPGPTPESMKHLF